MLMIIIITRPRYKSGKSMMTATCYKSDKLIMTSVLDHVLAHIIIDFVTTVL